MGKFSFILDSDLHFMQRDSIGSTIRPDKSNNVDFMIELINKNDDIKCVILAGDLTQSGSDGSRFLCYKYGGVEDQVSGLKHNYIDKLLEVGIPVHAVPGNHDWFHSSQRWPYIYRPVLGIIKEIENIGSPCFKNYTFGGIGSIFYSFDIEGVHFVACDIYANSKVRNRLKEDLSKKTTPNQPIILFQHYNFIGPWSDWWSQSDKDALYDIIKDYNVIGLLEGHHHLSGIKTEGYHDIPQFNAAGPGFMVCTYDPSTNSLTGKDIRSSKDLV